MVSDFFGSLHKNSRRESTNTEEQQFGTTPEMRVFALPPPGFELASFDFAAWNATHYTTSWHYLATDYKQLRLHAPWFLRDNFARLRS